jgi:uncharacterized membrane protein YgcG
MISIFMRKRGVSEVVVTLVLLLLAFVVIGIVWGVFNSVLKNSNSSDISDIDALSTNIEIENVRLDEDNKKLNFIVSKTGGENSVDSIDVIISDGENSKTINVKRKINNIGKENFEIDIPEEINIDRLKNGGSLIVVPLTDGMTDGKSSSSISPKYDFKENRVESISTIGYSSTVNSTNSGEGGGSSGGGGGSSGGSSGGGGGSSSGSEEGDLDVGVNDSISDNLTCNLTNATWSSLNVSIGEDVMAEVYGENCSGEELNFTIKKKESLLGIDWLYPDSVVFIGSSVASLNWKAGIKQDGSNSSGEYYFVVSLDSDGKENINSEDYGDNLIVNEEDLIVNEEDLVFIPNNNPDITNDLIYLGNPNMIRYPTNVWARNVWDLTYFKGKIYFGGGDYGENTGNTPIRFINVSDDSIVSEYNANTEQIERYVIINDSLYAPAIDPTGSQQIGFYRLNETGWHSYPSSNLYHTFDIFEFNGAIFSLTGPTDKSFFRKCLDVNCSTYKMIFFPQTLSTQSGSFHRLYDSIVIDGNLYAYGFMNLQNPAGEKFYYRSVRYNFNDTLTPIDVSDTDNLFKGYLNVATGYSPYSILPYNDVILNNRTYYMGANSNWASIGNSIFYAETFPNGVEMKLPYKAVPSDIEIINNEVYVLGFSGNNTQNYTNYVFKVNQEDDSFIPILNFNSTAYVRSFVYVPGTFYFGMGSDLSGKYLNVDSGQIYKYSYRE